MKAGGRDTDVGAEAEVEVVGRAVEQWWDGGAWEKGGGGGSIKKKRHLITLMTTWQKNKQQQRHCLLLWKEMQGYRKLLFHLRPMFDLKAENVGPDLDAK